MHKGQSTHWWIYFLRGIFAILFGTAALVSPQTAFATLIVLLGAFMIADGFFSIVYFVNEKAILKNSRWILLLGIIGIVAGVITFFDPVIAAITLLSLFAFCSFVAGLMDMIATVNHTKKTKGEKWYILLGILSTVAAILLLVNLPAGIITLTLIFGIYILSTGILSVSISLKLKKHVSAKKRFIAG